MPAPTAERLDQLLTDCLIRCAGLSLPLPAHRHRAAAEQHRAVPGGQLLPRSSRLVHDGPELCQDALTCSLVDQLECGPHTGCLPAGTELHQELKQQLHAAAGAARAAAHQHPSPFCAALTQAAWLQARSCTRRSSARRTASAASPASALSAATRAWATPPSCAGGPSTLPMWRSRQGPAYTQLRCRAGCCVAHMLACALPCLCISGCAGV